MCIGASEATKVGAIALAALVTKNAIAACYACVGAVRLSDIDATTAKTGSLILDAMKAIAFGGLYVKHRCKTKYS